MFPPFHLRLVWVCTCLHFSPVIYFSFIFSHIFFCVIVNCFRFLSLLPLLHTCENRLKYNFSVLSSSSSIELRARLCKILLFDADSMLFFCWSLLEYESKCFIRIQYVRVQCTHYSLCMILSVLCVKCVCFFSWLIIFYFGSPHFTQTHFMLFTSFSSLCRFNLLLFMIFM